MTEEIFRRGRLKVIPTGSGRRLAERIVPHLKEFQAKSGLNDLDSILINNEEVDYDSEIKNTPQESIRGSDIYVVADCANTVYPNPNEPFSIEDNFRAVKNTIDAVAKEANHVTVVLPYFPYARQDKRVSREGITAKIIAKELELVGARQVITFDIHNPAIAGFFDKAALEDLKASRNIIDQIKKDFEGMKNTVIGSPDAGGVKRAEYYSNQTKSNLVILHKERNYSKGGEIEKMTLVGNVVDYDILPLDQLYKIRDIINSGLPYAEGYQRIRDVLDSRNESLDVFLIDDMASTCGTMEKSLQSLKSAGANNISYGVTFALLNKGKRDPITGLRPNTSGKDKIIKYHNSGLLHKFYCADLIDHGDFMKENEDFIVSVSMDRYLAKAIHHLNTGRSISKLVDKNYKVH